MEEEVEGRRRVEKRVDGVGKNAADYNVPYDRDNFFHNGPGSEDY